MCFLLGRRSKLLAARYAKIKEVLVPAENRVDVEELDQEILDGLKISFADRHTMTDALPSAE